MLAVVTAEATRGVVAKLEPMGCMLALHRLPTE